MEVSRAHLHTAATALHEEAVAALRLDCGARPCANLCRRVNRAIEDELERARIAGVPVACAPGCSFCCHQRVSVLPHEAIALFLHLQTRVAPRERAEIERAVAANARRIDSMTAAEHASANVPCALLREGRCSAYEVRPSICASFHSLSRQRCEQSFRHPEGVGTPRNSRPAVLEVEAFSAAAISAVEAGCAQAGKQSGKLELHQALRTLLEDPSAIERWCADDALAGASKTKT